MLNYQRVSSMTDDLWIFIALMALDHLWLIMASPAIFCGCINFPLPGKVREIPAKTVWNLGCFRWAHVLNPGTKTSRNHAPTPGKILRSAQLGGPVRGWRNLEYPHQLDEMTATEMPRPPPIDSFNIAGNQIEKVNAMLKWLLPTAFHPAEWLTFPHGTGKKMWGHIWMINSLQRASRTNDTSIGLRYGNDK